MKDILRDELRAPKIVDRATFHAELYWKYPLTTDCSHFSVSLTDSCMR